MSEERKRIGIRLVLLLVLVLDGGSQKRRVVREVWKHSRSSYKAPNKVYENGPNKRLTNCPSDVGKQ